MTQLAEYYYDSGNAPHEALGRAARRLTGGALYLGGGVGIEKQVTKQGDQYVVTRTVGKDESFAGPLSAVMRGFSIAGGSTAADTPGGETQVTDPAVAARLRELVDNERECRKDIERIERRIAAQNQQQATGMILRPNRDDEWDARRLRELRADLASIEAERRKLLASGKVEEVEQARPGTNFTKIPPQNVKKLSPIIKHYAGMAHPFRACVRDQMKHGLSEDHANRRCAVVKDLGRGTTKWRKGGVKEAHEASLVAARVAEACGRLEAIDSQLGAGACVELAERAGEFGDAAMDALGEGAFADLGQLFLAGHPFGVVWQQVREGFAEDLHPRDFLGQFRKKLASLKPGETAHAPSSAGPGRIVVTRKADGFHVKGGAGLGHVRVPDGSFEAGQPAADEKHAAPNIAAMMATNRSLRSRDPKSLGGAKHFQSLDDYEKHHGKPAKDPNITRTRMAHDQQAGREAHEANLVDQFKRPSGPGYANAVPGELKSKLEGLKPGRSTTLAGVKVTRQPNGDYDVAGDKNLTGLANVVASVKSKRGRSGGQRVTRPLPDHTPGLADSPGESARGAEATRRFERSRGPAPKGDATYDLQKELERLPVGGKKHTGLPERGGVKIERTESGYRTVADGTSLPHKSAGAAARHAMSLHRQRSASGAGERGGTKFAAGDKVVVADPSPRGGVGVLTHTFVRKEGDQAVLKAPDDPSLGGGKEKRVPFEHVRKKDAAGGTTGETAAQTRKRAQDTETRGPASGTVHRVLRQVERGTTGGMSRRRKQDLVSRGLAKWDGPGQISLTDKGRKMIGATGSKKVAESEEPGGLLGSLLESRA